MNRRNKISIAKTLQYCNTNNRKKKTNFTQYKRYRICEFPADFDIDISKCKILILIDKFTYRQPVDFIFREEYAE